LAVERETTDRDHTVDMRMMLKVLAPGVEHTQEANLRAEMLCVSRDREQSGHWCGRGRRRPSCSREPARKADVEW
jgi:hypothetical protein